MITIKGMVTDLGIQSLASGELKTVGISLSSADEYEYGGVNLSLRKLPKGLQLGSKISMTISKEKD